MCIGAISTLHRDRSELLVPSRVRAHFHAVASVPDADCNHTSMLCVSYEGPPSRRPFFDAVVAISRTPFCRDEFHTVRKIDVYFLALATLCLVRGVLLVMGVGFAQDFSMSHLHSHLNLVGWTSMALFGLTYRAYPVLAESQLAKIHFLISAPSGILFPIGIYLLIAHDQPALAVITGLAWLAGVALFCATLVRFALARSQP